jgi:2-polyprenyl-3-methyl-5-hydroxy-6-metoxy-1,4-benzoquinol methylase
MALERLGLDWASWSECGQEHLERYLFASERIRGARVLDIACGTGYGSWVLAQAGASAVVGVDRDEEAVVGAAKQFQRPNLSFRRVAAEELGTKGEFDAVVSFETIEHVPDPKGFIALLRGALRPGGTLILSSPNPLLHSKEPGADPNPYHIEEPTHDQLMEWMRPHFSEFEHYGQFRTFYGTSYEHTRLTALSRSRFLKLILSAESVLRKVMGQPPLEQPIVSHRLVSTRQILPLPPTMREFCQNFVIVAR